MASPLEKRLCREFVRHGSAVLVFSMPFYIYALVAYGTEGLIDMLLGAAGIGAVLGLFFVVVTWLEVAAGFEAVDADVTKRPSNRDGS